MAKPGDGDKQINEGPVSTEAEASVLGRMMNEPETIGEVIGTLLEASHFGTPAHRVLFGAMRKAHERGDIVDPLTTAELNSKRLAELWAVEEDAAVKRILAVADSAAMRSFQSAPIADHARLVRRHAEYRRLIRVARSIERAVEEEKLGPEEIAGQATQAAMKVAMSSQSVHEIESFEDAGRAFYTDMRQSIAARSQGVEVGAYTGIDAFDDYVRGERPGELMILGGEPGTGKSSITFAGTLGFAKRQAARPLPPEKKPVGALILCLEMARPEVNTRWAQMLSGVDGTKIREAKIEKREFDQILDDWRAVSGVPLYLNYAPSLRVSQMVAIVSEAIRAHNVGLVVIDHFRMFDLDTRLPNRNDEDEEKVRALKEQIARNLNVAVICLAHTRKTGNLDGRPLLSDLRGSGQVAAHADFVAFVFRPAMYASKKEIESGNVLETDAELIFRKNRHGLLGSGDLYFDPSRMFVK